MIRYLDNEAFLDISLFLKKCYFSVFIETVKVCREHPVYYYFLKRNESEEIRTDSSTCKRA